MEDWSSILLSPVIVSCLLGAATALMCWFLWRSRRGAPTTPTPSYSRSSSQVYMRENSNSGAENSSKSNQVKQRRKRYSIMNTVSHELAGFGRRATSFSKTRLESVRNALVSASNVPRKQIMSRLAKVLLPSDTPTKRVICNPPSRMFEDDYGEAIDPTQALGMLRAIRAFSWGVEKGVFHELCKSIDTLTLEKGDMLFDQGSEDDSIYVVQRGHIDLLLVEDSKEFVIKSVREGENVFSMTAIIERLAGYKPLHGNVSARCALPTQVARLPIAAFVAQCQSHPNLSFATVQTITIKLSRVVFNALHACLGLSGELVRDFRSATASVQSLSRSLSLSSTDSLARRRSAAQSRRPPLSKRYSTQEYDAKPPDAIVQPVGRSLNEVVSTLGEEKIFDAVANDLKMLFNVRDRSFVDGALKTETYNAGVQIHGQDDRNVNLCIIVYGVVQAFSRVPDEDQDELFFTAHAGSLLGQLSILSGEPSIYSLRAKTDAILVSISRDAISNLFRELPQTAVPLANFVVSELSPFVRQLDHSLGWKQIESGRALYRQNDVADCAYVILHGRIRNVLKKTEDKREVISEHGRDEVIGLVEILTQSKRMFTSLAVRDTEVGSIPAGLIHWLKRSHPKIVTKLIHVIGNRLVDVRQRAIPSSVEHPLPMLKNRPPLRNLSTIAVVPASKDVPLSSFTLELQHALNAVGPSLRLTGMLVMSQLGAAAFDSINEYHLQTWLSQQEETYRMILYQCDSTCTPWSRWCLRQADAVLEVALASADPSISSQSEFDLERVAVRAQKELVLLYKHDYEGLPRKTNEWLAARGWCHGHHHIRCPKRLLATSSPNRIISTYRRLFDSEPNPFSDFSRLARYLTGTSIGLALGGGGARGIAHIGVMKALFEAGIPVDMVAGTSIGSFMSALWAREMNLSRMTEVASKMADRMLHKGALLYDLTYPYAGMFTGRNFNSIIRDAVSGNINGEEGFSDNSDTQIEDLWLPYACVTTDVTASKMRIHTSGSLWRYVRASMTLAGYMPPLCDPNDGHLLVDGGYTNNLPADVLRAMGCSVVFTVDVGAVDETDLTDYGDELSGWSLLWKRLWPWARQVKVPNIADIQSRLAYVACCRQLEVVKQQPYCIYVRPPIDKYKTLAFNMFDDINRVGYNYGRKFFSTINVRRFFVDLYSQRSLHFKNTGVAAKNSPSSQIPKNFTELAEMVCRIDQDFSTTIDETEEDDNDNVSVGGDVIDSLIVNQNTMPHVTVNDDDTNSSGYLHPQSFTFGAETNGNSTNSSLAGTLAANSRSNSRRNSIRAQLLNDDDDEDLDDDPVFDDRKGVTPSRIDQERSLSDTELPMSTETPRGQTMLPLEAESLPISMNSGRNHQSLSD